MENSSSSVSGLQPGSNNRSLRNERLRVRRQQESHEERPNRLQLRRSRRLLARQQESDEQRELSLQTRRERQHQESDEQRELRLQTRRERQRQRRQQESSEQRQHRLDRLRTRNRSMEQFKADLTVSLTYCEVCHCLLFVGKAKEMSNTIVVQACPIDLDQVLTNDEIVVICSKCHTQISKGHWPSTACNNNLAPDTIPLQLAVLTADEVRIVCLICPFSR